MLSVLFHDIKYNDSSSCFKLIKWLFTGVIVIANRILIVVINFLK